MLKRIWNDPVWSKVISAAILGAAAVAGTYFLNWWPAIGALLSRAVTFIGASSAVPNWLTGLAVLFALPTVFLLAALCWQVARPAKQVAAWQAYTSDVFFGLRWRWQYSRTSEMHSLLCFCPHCDFQVFPLSASPYGFQDRILFRCESCHRELATFEESYQSLESKATRFAQQKLRNGTWNSGN
jgi:hypothetical protein